MTAVLVPGLVLVRRTKTASSSQELDADPFMLPKSGLQKIRIPMKNKNPKT